MIVAVDHKQAGYVAPSNQSAVQERNIAIDYLRAFAVVLVLLHHAILAYTTFATINIENPIATSSPVVDDQRWIGFDLIVAFNETFLMPLLFFISGTLVWQSLARQGARNYIIGRLRRLGIPFVLGVFFLIPMAYYPAQLQVDQITGVHSTYAAFWLNMIRSGFVTAGPLWFLWLLLAFNCLAVLLHRFWPGAKHPAKDRLPIILGCPIALSGTMFGLSILVYLPVVIIIGPLEWIGIGPFHAQASRILLYLLFFSAGALVGVYGLDRGSFTADSILAQRWWAWFAVGLLSFFVFILMVAVVAGGDGSIICDIAFLVCCVTYVLGMTGFFLSLSKRRFRILDSLSNNSYGIYIVHYVFITWLQYLLLSPSVSPIFKGMAVFLITLLLSWATIAAIRHIPLAAKVI